MLARATGRRRQVSIRLALGAGRGRVLRQLIAESLLLSMTGGVLGLMAGAWGLHELVALAPEDLPRLAAVRLDATVVAFALGLAAVTGVVCALVAAFSGSGVNLVDALKDGTRGSSSGPMAQRLRFTLVGGEIAAAVILVAAAGLLVRSLGELQAVPWGVDPARVYTARVAFLDPRYDTDDARRAFARELLSRVQAMPGVEKTSLGLDRVGEGWIRLPFTPEGHAYATPEETPQAYYHMVSADYFATLGVPVLHGRAITVADDERSRPVAVVDASLAHQFFPGGQAVGRHMRLTWFGQDGGDVEIVGVVGNVKTNGPEGVPSLDLYLPFAQRPMNSVFVNVRSALPAASVDTAVRRVVKELDAGVPVALGASLQQVIDRSGATRGFPMALIGAFATLALGLAALGIYAILAYAVGQRTHEIGLRIALGAAPAQVVWLVVRQCSAPVLAGLAGGIAGAVMVARAMRSLLFGIQPLDAWTFLMVPVILLAVVSIACWVPARRAVAIDPLRLLRTD
jgi:putative ABC transport system permease protein